ncbi:MAG TPA: FAD-dependent oxidoreductase [Bacteroidales bacterium]|nr:FAD-dependent oxidoreductase [Bacteroidales bacterium]HPT21091.1 FAD-dependent oxidoreductase [Bacteroidales bacterium]
MDRNIVVIGGGTAGMEAAGQLSKEGFKVTLVEKESDTGGHLRNWYHLFPDRRDSVEVMNYLKTRIVHDNITLMTGTTIESFEKRDDSFALKTTSGGELIADAVVVTTGFDLFRCEKKEEYGYGIYDNVITSADLEKMFRKGEVKRSDGVIPEKIGLVHCVGSRDEKSGNRYCSKLCCVTAVKQAIELKEMLPAAKVFCFYMDIRMGGALYEEMYREAQEGFGVNFIRGKVSEVSENIDNKLVAKVEDTLLGRPMKIELDMMILMAGMEMSAEGRRIALSSGLKTGENRFFSPADHHFGSNMGNVGGVFYAGTCTAPMNITDTISHARAVVSDVVDYLKTM